MTMNMSFILKSMVKIKRPIIMEFVLRDQLLMSLKLIVIGSLKRLLNYNIIMSLTKFFSFKCYWYNIADKGIKVDIIFWSKLTQRLNFATSTMSLFCLSNANKFITHTLFHLEMIVLKLIGYQ